MSDNEYMNSLVLIYKYLLKGIVADNIEVYGYIANAMNVIENVMKKRGR